MSRKLLVGGGVAIVVLIVALASMLFFAKVQPTEAEVRKAVELALPDGAVVDQMTFAVFSDDRSKGRVSVKGTYSFTQDIYSLPTPPAKLMRSLASAQIFDTEVSKWWSENSSFYPQFKGQLGEFRKIYSSGESLEFSGELPYLAVVDGTKVDGTSLDYTRRDGTVEPEFGYADGDEQISELTAAIVEWRDRRRDEEAAAAAARAAEVEAAAEAKAAEAEAEAAARARAAEIEAEAAIKAAAAEAEAAAAAEAAAERARAEAVIDAEASPCLRTNTDKLGCITVVFGHNTKYDRTGRYDDATAETPAKSYCIFHDGGDAVQVTHLGGDHYRFVGPDGLVVQFFDLPLGESFRGLTCGG